MSKYFLSFIICLFIYFSDCIFTKEPQNTTKPQESFLLQALQDNPENLALSVISAFGGLLFFSEIKNFIQDNKGPLFFTAFSAVSLSYIFKKTLINYLTKNYEQEHLLEYIQHLENQSSIPEEDNQENQNVESEESHQQLSFAKCGARIYYPGEIKTSFKDVAGLENAKEDFHDIIIYMKNKKPFVDIGAHIPNGILLYGPPGNGKTLLARAVAGEINCPFIYINASEFIEAIVGIGAARIRHLFKIAKSIQPCVIYIDEIDAIGKKRTSSHSGGDTEQSQTINELLSQLDGFEQHNDIVVIASTNMLDILDPALIRPGRFDRIIKIPHPFLKDRYKILQYHLNKVKHDPYINIYKLAQVTPGCSGAQLEQLINEAAIIALRQECCFVTMYHIDQARDNINLGKETKGMDLSKEESWHTAVHEAGHALVRVLLPDALPLYKVTITPRNKALGITYSQPLERYSLKKEQIEAEITVCLAGSVAEEYILNQRTAGSQSDLQTTRQYATDMVMRYGMTEEFKDISFQDFIHNEIYLPQELSLKLNYEINSIISSCRQKALNLIMQNQELLEQLAFLLQEKGTVLGSEVYNLCNIKEPNIEFSLS